MAFNPGLRRFRWKGLVTVGAGAGLLALAAFLALPGLREYVYREASYSVVLEQVAHGESDPLILTDRVLFFVQEQMYPGPGYTIDTDPWSSLVRGIGWCDQKVWTVGTFLSLTGVRSRIIQFYTGLDGPSIHAALVVRVGGKWVYYDPLFGITFKLPDGTPATWEDVSGSPELLQAQPVFASLAPEAQEHVLLTYNKIFNSHRPPSLFLSMVKSRAPKAFLANPIHRLWRLLGPTWANAFQDLHLALLPKVPENAHLEQQDPHVMSLKEFHWALRTYYAARNYHLYGRWEKALAEYRRVIQRCPASYLAKWCRLWAGNAELQAGRPQEAAQILVELLERLPDGEIDLRWRVYNQLELVVERGQGWEAARYFRQLSLQDPNATTAMRLVMEKRWPFARGKSP
ncbi:MAG: tetratricopeptide repeat protein [Candidatus Omnitrophica bacterium]|nr:tetratricopeptide repeat protein [Candidatus Omnitrophota bacterium]